MLSVDGVDSDEMLLLLIGDKMWMLANGIDCDRIGVHILCVLIRGSVGHKGSSKKARSYRLNESLVPTTITPSEENLITQMA